MKPRKALQISENLKKKPKIELIDNYILGENIYIYNGPNSELISKYVYVNAKIDSVNIEDPLIFESLLILDIMLKNIISQQEILNITTNQIKLLNHVEWSEYPRLYEIYIQYLKTFYDRSLTSFFHTLFNEEIFIEID